MQIPHHGKPHETPKQKNQHTRKKNKKPQKENRRKQPKNTEIKSRISLQTGQTTKKKITMLKKTSTREKT